MTAWTRRATLVGALSALGLLAYLRIVKRKSGGFSNGFGSGFGG
jgi:hypothetical protein